MLFLLICTPLTFPQKYSIIVYMNIADLFAWVQAYDEKLNKIRNRHDDKHQRRDRLVALLFEEGGELAKELRKFHGRGRVEKEPATLDTIAEEIGDCVVVLAQIMLSEGIKLDTCLDIVKTKLENRIELEENENGHSENLQTTSEVA